MLAVLTGAPSWQLMRRLLATGSGAGRVGFGCPKTSSLATLAVGPGPPEEELGEASEAHGFQGFWKCEELGTHCRLPKVRT